MIKQLKNKDYHITSILQAIQLPRRTYYNWINYKISKRHQIDEYIKAMIKRIWQNNYKVYGVPRIQIAFRTMNVSIGAKRIKRLMNELDVHSLMARRFKKPGTHVDYSQWSNLIKNLNEPHSIWRADISYIELNPGQWVYLSTVLEDHSSKVLDIKFIPV